jgi:4-alpha-glucanotransferase
MDAIAFGLMLNLHQPPGNFDELLERNEWEAKEIWWAPDIFPAHCGRTRTLRG